MNAEESAGFLSGDMAYLKVGEGPPLVFAAGLAFDHEIPTGMTRRMMRSWAAPFAQHFTVYFVTRKKGLEPGESMADIAGHLGHAIDSALQLAIDRPDLVLRLVLLGSACRLGPEGRAVQAELARSIRAGDPVRGWAEVMATMMPGLLQRPARGLWRVALGPVVPKDSSDVLVTVEAEDVFDVEASLPRITAPTLVVGGAHDAGYSRELFEATARGIPDGRVHIIEGKGHATVGTATTMHLALGFLLGGAARLAS